MLGTSHGSQLQAACDATGRVRQCRTGFRCHPSAADDGFNANRGITEGILGVASSEDHRAGEPKGQGIDPSACCDGGDHDFGGRSTLLREPFADARPSRFRQRGKALDVALTKRPPEQRCGIRARVVKPERLLHHGSPSGRCQH